MVREVKNKTNLSDQSGSEKPRTRRPHTRISAKHQVTIPAGAFEGAGLAVGDRLEAKPLGVGKVLLERVESSVARFAGALTGAWETDEESEKAYRGWKRCRWGTSRIVLIGLQKTHLE